jgi:putative transcriptional regulator
MVRDEINNRIRELRAEHDEMTQLELAARVGCTRQTIHLLEYGRYSPSLGLAFRIAEVFGLTVDEVFDYEGRKR